MSDLPTGTVTFLFTDIERSTRLLEKLGKERYAEVLHTHRRLLRGAFARHGGVEVDTQGDALFTAFATAERAVAAAGEAQSALAGEPVMVRMGVHTGTPLVTDEGYVGMDVHRAARLAAAGHGGQVLISAASAGLVGATRLRDLGDHRLKDLVAAERIYQLGDAEFPPLRSLFRTNLPVPMTAFLGRQQELAEVGDLLTGSARLLTLTGPGGTGKTRLALQAAAEAAEHFPDGITWVPLAPLREVTRLLPTLAGALGLKEESRDTLPDALARALGGRRTLVLFDNAEHLLPGFVDELADVQGIDGPSILVTSRERLQLQGEHVYRVPPLGEQDGVQLFVERAAALGSDVERSSTVVELCRRLDDLPLALELAAARTPLFSPDQLLERLGGRLDLLKGGRDADPRQQTLRATIDWSYELLSDEERRLFRRLSVFVAGCALEDAETVAGADPDTLQSLLDKSLLRRRTTALGPWFWMLETIREYATERLDEAAEQSLLEDRLIDHAREFARAAEPAWRVGGEQPWLSRFDLELDNLRRAMRAALDCGDAERALSIAANLGWIWQMRGLMREGMSWIEDGLAVASNLEPGIDGYARFILGAGWSELGEPDRAVEPLEQSLPLLEAGALHHQHTFALYYLGGQLVELGRLDDAEDVLGRAEREALALADPTLVYSIRDGLADLYADRGDRVRARALLEEQGEMPNPAHRADQWVTMAEIVAGDGELSKAESLVDEAVALCEQGGFRRELAYAMRLRGYLQVLSGSRDEAVAALETSRTIGEESGTPTVVGAAALGLAAAEARWGQPEVAVELWGRARALGVSPKPESWRLERTLEREFLEPLRPALAEAVFDAAWARGWTPARTPPPPKPPRDSA